MQVFKMNLTAKHFEGLETVPQLIDFLNKHGAKYIDSGSSRMVYRISPNRVIKIAQDGYYTTPGAGRAQNQREVEVTEKYGHTKLFANVTYYHNNYLWIIARYAKGYEADEYDEEDFVQKHKEELNKFGIGDLEDNPFNFGVINNRLVVLDYGFSEEIGRQFY